MPTAEIVSIGSELLLGQIVDTNASWMAQRLTGLGVDLYFKTIVGDNPGRMREVISRALDRSDVVLTGGGLGPTQDDITREAIADVTGRELVKDPELLGDIERRFRSRGFVMTENNVRQAFIPKGAIPVANPNGTAPSFVVEDSRGSVFALPGVPFELKWLFDNEVVPYLQRKFGLDFVITYRVLKVADIGESAVDQEIGRLIAESSNPTVGVLAHPGQVDVRIAAKASNQAEADALIAPVEEQVRGMLGSHVFATDDETMEDVVGAALRDSGKSIAVYEDLTAGMVAQGLQTADPGSFAEGIIGSGTVAVDRLLADIQQRGLANSGAEALAGELAKAVREHTGATLGLAVHCVADPSDTAENLAAGYTYMSITDGDRARARTYNFAGRGRPDRTRLSLNALELVRRTLMEGFR